MKLTKKALSIHIALLCAAPQLVNAASFQILEQSPAQLGKAFAGSASDVLDATTVFFNPAGMTALENNMVSGGINLISAQAEFQDSGSNTTGPSGETDELAVVPNLYSVTKLSDQWAVGVGLNAPWGLASSYEPEWVGRYLATESELQVLNFNATTAFALNEQWSFGFGINYQHAEVTLENRIDSFAGAAPVSADADSAVAIEGDDSDFVLDLSVHWRPTAAASVGLLWRQGGEFDLAGEADFTPSATCAAIPACAGGLAALEGDIEASVELPDTLTLSGSYRFSELWAIHADIAQTKWSSIQSVDIVNSDNQLTLDSLDLYYDDTQRISLGVTYTPQSAWQWRAGVAMDEAPQTDPVYVTPRIPDADRTWLSAGLNYAFSESLSLDAAYTHILVDDAEVNSVTEGNFDRVVSGSFDSKVNIIGIQLNWSY